MKLFSINKNNKSSYIKEINIKSRLNFGILLLIKIILFFLILELLLYRDNNYFNIGKNNLITFNTFYVNNDTEEIKNAFEYFKLFDINYFFSLKFNIIKIEYKIGFYNNKNNIILPSDLTLYKNLHFFCFIEIANKRNNTIINSLPNIYQNSLFKCTEFYNINEKIKIGFKIYQSKVNETNIEDYKIFFFKVKTFDYNKLNYKHDKIFDFIILNNQYKSIIEKMNDKNVNESLKLKKSYLRYPLCLLKRYSLERGKWAFLNLYNEYFCFCKGLDCINKEICKKCKYYLYLNIIDNNRYIYKKTDLLFIDFIFNELSSDDAFPVFKEMAYQNLPVHYMTENLNIYNEFCYHKNKCITIIFVNKKNYTINGDFLEKYLTLFLKLKQVISGGGMYFNYINNIFYNIEYITYISITHGVCFFKYFLYEDYACYGKKRVDKIVIPPSDKIISIIKKYGWKEEDIIKLNLPRWDKYNNLSSNLEKNEKYKNNSIFILFTWRSIIKNKKISNDYIKNIINILNNNILIESLKKNNIILYFSIHHKINEYNKHKKKFLKYENIKLVENNEIAECLTQTSLIVTDFSSIIFDLIYKKKPFIIYVPDANDPQIENIYDRKYYELIKSLKNGTIKFENKFFDINETVNKIIYYINNNFKLDKKLELFYNNLGIIPDNNVKRFIQYITTNLN